MGCPLSRETGEMITMQFYVLNASGEKYGPATLEQLYIWAREGRLVAATLVEETETGRCVPAEQVLQENTFGPVVSPLSPNCTGSSHPAPLVLGTPLAPVPYLSPLSLPVAQQVWPPAPHSVPQQMVQAKPRRNVAAAVLLTLVLPGASQIYNQQIVKGCVSLAVSFLLASVTYGVAAMVIWPILMIDGGIIAGRINRGEKVGPWKFF